ncbi:MAG: transport system ATP-binding/permease protein [Thermoleophilaceae bacterium]|nr:transport system ATP-binding/permease protein [Thermoleophilaceae bacterium]
MLESFVLLYEGRRYPVGPEGLGLGRAEENDVPLAAEQASRRHARVVLGPEGLVLEDLGSRHGTQLNGELLKGEARPVAVGDRIEIGGTVVRVLAGGETRFESGETTATPLTSHSVVFDGRRLTIGRQDDNDLVLPDPNVSRAHAELVGRDGGVEVVDLGARNGTRLDGVPISRAKVEPGSTIGVGPYQLHFDGSRLVARDSRAELQLTASDVTVKVGAKEILFPVSLAIEPGELVVLIGESGAGKTTLLKVLAGVNAPSGGAVTVNGEPLAARLTDVGYMPQDEIVHPELSVREALSYAARLRLPQDTSSEEIDSTVDRVLAELSLEQHGDTRIGSLSGGQRKRAGLGAELLSRPSLLFLDEPTTGLDPSLEGRLMALLRELADGGRGVVVVTHATASLSMADRVVVMGAGGYRTFEGSPSEALRFFGVDSFEGIYEKFDDAPPTEWRERFEAGSRGTAAPAEVKPPAEGSGATAGRRPKLIRQTRVLAARQALVFVRDRKNLALLFGQVPILALLDALIFQSGIFHHIGGNPGDGVQLMFLTVLAPIWFGALDSAREIVKERPMRDREAAIGVRLDAYLFAKCAVLFVAVTAQTILLAVIVFAARSLHEPASAYLGLLAILALTGCAAVTMGLLVSALVTTEDQAMTVIPLVLIPQILFAGAIVPIQRMLEPFKSLANLDISMWSLSSVGTQVDFNSRIAQSPEFARVNRFGTHFFDVPLGQGVGMLAIFLVAFLAGTGVVLQRRARSTNR